MLADFWTFVKDHSDVYFVLGGVIVVVVVSRLNRLSIKLGGKVTAGRGGVAAGRDISVDGDTGIVRSEDYKPPPKS